MVRYFEKEQLKKEEQATPEKPEAQAAQPEQAVQYVEREVTLSLLNQKINILTELVVSLHEQLSSEPEQKDQSK